MSNRLSVLLVIISVAVALATPAAAQMGPTRVVVVEARMLDAPATITLVATVQPVRRSRVGAAIPGICGKMPVREGDRVSKGEVVCRLINDTLEHRLDEGKASLNALRARHEELIAGTRKEELVRLRAMFDEAVAKYEQSKFEMQRIEKLYEGRDSNDKEYYDTRAEFLTAERRKIAAEANYDLGVKGPREEVVARAAYEVAEQQAVVNRIEADLRKMVIEAPFDGYVVTRDVEIGEWVPLGGQVVEMIELSSVLVRVDAPESALPYFAVGDVARVKIDALKRSFDGRIKHIVLQADPNARTFPVDIELDNSEGLLAAGMFARATVAAGPKGAVVAVPKDAIVERGGITKIAVVAPGERGGMVGRLTGVTVGADIGDWSAITSDNIQPGMQVITRGNERMLPFPTPVVIVDEMGTPVAVPDVGEPVTGQDGA